MASRENKEAFRWSYGVAWYRTAFSVPAAARGKKIGLLFGAVDESAKVWMNDLFVGDHPYVHANDWKTPFELDITDAVRFGRENSITVWVEDRVGAGGIWKPIWLLGEE